MPAYDIENDLKILDISMGLSQPIRHLRRRI